MPDIERAAFAGTEEILNEEWATLTVTGHGQQATEEFLEGFGWDQKAAGITVIRLSPDNRRVTAARFALAGRWQDEACRIQAKKLWNQLDENVILEVGIDNLTMFRFADGEMWSDYLQGDSLPHRFVVTGDQARVMSDEELAAKNVGDFSYRAVCALAKSSTARWGIWVSVAILIFPEAEKAMLDISPAAADPAWPGIGLTSGEVQILPRAGTDKEVLNGKEWGCPIAPAIIPGMMWTTTAGPLTGAEVRTAVGALLNNGCMTETSVAKETMRKKWSKAKANPDDLRRKKAEKTWPAETTAPAKKGRKTKRLNYIHQ